MLKVILATFASGLALVASEHQDSFRANLEAMAASPELAEITALQGTDIRAESDEDDGFWSAEEGSFLSRLRPYVVKDGILQVPVMGVLLHRFPYAWGSFATGYAYIERALKRGEADGNVRGYALISNSPGGMVAGCFELCDFIQNGLTKPIKAYASDHSYSAAYALASQAETLSVTRSGGVGSVGVVTSHVDWSDAMEKAGIKITFIHAGKHKVDGNPYQELSAAARKRIQARIDKLYGVFVSTVARGRDMDEDDVRNTEALCYDAEEAIEIGFADKIESAEDGLKDYAAELNLEDERMAQGQDTGKKFGDAEMESAVNAARAEGKAEGEKAGAKAERERISAVLTTPAAEGREAAAIEMALDQDTAFTAATAEKMLNRIPKTGASTATTTNDNANGGGEGGENARGGSHFNDAMERSGNPEVGGAKGGQGGDKAQGKGDGPSDDEIASRVIGNMRASRGDAPAK